MRKSSSTIQDMTHGSPAKLLFFFAMPLMLGNVFQQMYTMVDTIVVGRGVGVQALASVGAADWMNWMFLGLATSLTQGFAILMSQNYGAGDYHRLRKTVGVSVSLSVGAAVLFTLIAHACVNPLLDLMNTAPEIYGGSEIYLRFMFSGIPIILAYNLAASILRALGDSKSPLYAMIIASLLNIVLDLVFVMVFHWGILGAASATLIAQVFSFLYCLRMLRRVEILHLKKSDLALEWGTSLQLLRLGMPVMFQNMVISVGGMVVQSVINLFGFLFVAGFTATNKMYGLLEMAAISFGFAMTTYTGQNLGAGRLDRIRKGMKSAAAMALGTSVGVSVVMLVFGRRILGMFVSGDPAQVEQVLDIAYHYLRIMSCFLAVLYALHVYRCALQGLGDTVTPMISGIVEFFMRIGAVLLLPRIFGQEVVFYAEILAWAGAATLLVSAYYWRMHRLTKASFRSAGAIP